MVEVTGKTTCPGCNKDHDFKIEFDMPTIPKAKEVKVETGSNTVQTVIEKPVAPEVKTEDKHDTVLPNYIPSAVCKNCGDNHKNKEYRHPPKARCTNCGQFHPLKKGKCTWCGSTELEEVDKEELEELGVTLPEERLS